MDFSWSEMLIVGIVALIVIGPKDLPGMFRELGRFTAKIRSMSREFSRAMEQAAKESGVKEAADSLKAASNPVGTGLNAVKSAADKFEKWDPIKNAAVPTRPLTPPPMPALPTTATAATLATSAAETPALGQVPAPVTTGADPGPATKALIEKQAARKAIIDEMNQKLRELDTPPVSSTAAASSTPAAGAAPAKAKPGRTRKSKADTE